MEGKEGGDRHVRVYMRIAYACMRVCACATYASYATLGAAFSKEGNL